MTTIPFNEDTTTGGAVPRHLESEEIILSALFQDPEKIVPRAFSLRGTFYSQPLGEIYEAIMAASGSNAGISVESVADCLRERGTLEKCGGVPRLIELSTEIGVGLFPAAKKRVEITARARVLFGVLNSGSNRLLHANQPDELAEIIEETQNQIMDLERVTHEQDPKAWKEACLGALEQIQERFENKGAIPGLSTGFPDLDERTGGLQRGASWVIAARPGKGKTSLALNFAENIADSVPVLFFSAEMDAAELATRSLSRASGIENSRLAAGRLRGAAELQQFHDATAKHANKQIFVDDAADMSIPRVRAIARRYVRGHGVGLVIIDYLQLLESGEKSRSREEEVRKMSKSFKNMARELHVPVVVLAQLNRESEKAGRRPKKSELRESGAIEQDADVVLLIHHEEEESEDPTVYSPTIDCELIADKIRNGREGTVPATYHRPTTTFEPVD